jgi:hypothetical protein
VQTFPDLREKQQVSTEGGEWPRWSRDGRELFFASARRMMAAGVSPGGESLHPTTPQVLFPWADDSRQCGGWDVAPDGRFLMFRRGEGSTITIVLNWFEELKAMSRKAEE